MMRKDNPLLLRLRPVVWMLAVVFGLVGSTLQAQRSPRFDYFYMEALHRLIDPDWKLY